MIDGNEPLLVKQTKRTSLTAILFTGGCALFICAIVFVSTLLIAGPAYVREFIPNLIQQAALLNRGTANNNTMGDPNAPVTIVEYGDFQCPYCLKFWRESEPQLIDQYINTGKVYFEYRSYPFLGQESVDAAEAAYCAGDQGKFWEYHDMLYSNWAGENKGAFNHENLVRFAKNLKLDQQAFESCLKDGTHLQTVEQDRAKADADGVRATPTFIINGYKLEGAQSFEIIQHIIEEALKGPVDEQNG